jgi:hypothetical protein
MHLKIKIEVMRHCLIVFILLLVSNIQGFTQEKLVFSKGIIILPQSVIKNSKPRSVQPEWEEEKLAFIPDFSEYYYGKQYLNIRGFEMKHNESYIPDLIKARENRVKRYRLPLSATNIQEVKSMKGYRSLIIGDFSTLSNVSNVIYFFIINKSNTAGVSGELKFLTEDKNEAMEKVMKLINSVEFN